MNSTFVRRTGLALTAASLTVGLAACGSASSNSPTGAMTSSTTAASAGAQTFGPACGAIPKTGAGSFDGMVKDPVATAASNNPLLSTLVAAVVKAGLVDTLNNAQGLTVFAPTNDAFKKLPAATLNQVLNDKALLTSILTHHVVAGQLDPMAVVGEHSTLNKDSVTVSGSTSGMKVDGANVLCGNIPTSNATVYVIDTVLVPASK